MSKWSPLLAGMLLLAMCNRSHSQSPPQMPGVSNSRQPSAQSAVVTGIVPGPLTGRPDAPMPLPMQKSKQASAQPWKQMPLYFEANRGQVDPRVRFSAHAPGYEIFLTSGETVLQLRRQAEENEGVKRQPGNWDHLRAQDTSGDQNENPPKAVQKEARNASGGQGKPAHSLKTASLRETASLRMKLIGASTHVCISGEKALPGKVNYIRGNDPAGWRTNVTTYRDVRYKDIYPGIDLLYYGNQRQLEYDFIVKPHADPKPIGFDVSGAKKVIIRRDGDLVMSTSLGDVVWHKPVVYQESMGKRQTISARYSLQEGRHIAFVLGKYDPSHPLVIDPSLAYSTYLGGTGDEYGNGVATDGAGNAYVCGQTSSTNFPTTSSAYQKSYGNGSADAYVAKYNSHGSLVYCTYLGGSDYDGAYGIAVDSSGNAYITGSTYSTNFPTKTGALYIHKRSSYASAFISRLSSAGSLAYSTYFSGTYHDWAEVVAIDKSGNAYITGYSLSGDLPTTSAAYQKSHSYYNYYNAYVAKLDPTLSSITYCTYLQGTRESHGRGIAIDSNNNCIVVGNTSSRDYPTTNGAYQTVKKGHVLHKTTDGAANWSLSETGYPGSEVYSLAIDPKNSNIIYANGDAGLYKSTNGGSAWTFANLNPFLNTIIIDPVTTSTLYVPYYAGVLKSTNSGSTWTFIGPNYSVNTDSRHLAIDPSSTSTLYLAAIQGVYKSTNGGSTWTTNISGLPKDSNGNVNAYAVAVDQTTTSTIYVGVNVGVYKSTDSRASWSASNTGMPKDGNNNVFRVSLIAIDPTNSAIVYARSDEYNGHMMRSADYGATWSDTNTSGVVDNVNAFVIDPVTTTTIYHAADNDIWKSTDSGQTWSNSLYKINGRALAIDPANHNTLYCGSWIAWDGFVTKLNSSGSGLVYSTYLGGEFFDFFEHVAVDGSDNAIVGGWSLSSDIPVKNASQATLNGYINGVISKFSPTGANVYTTYLGGNSDDRIYSLAADAAGNAYVTGPTYSNNFYVHNALQSTFQGYQDVFVTKLSANGQTILYSSYMGTSDYQFSRGIATDGTNIFVVGRTTSSQFPLSYFPPQSSNAGGSGDVFVTNTVPDNSPPVLRDDTYTVLANTVLNVAAPGLLANDTDPDNDPITIRIYYVPPTGSMIMYTNGRLVYTPALNYRGAVPSGYFASAGSNAMSYANITINVVNPVPAITTLVPNPVYAGDPGLTLTINGTGFFPDSTVAWNGVTRAATYVSTSALKINVSAADIAAVGSAAVTVFNPAPAGGTSPSAVLNILARNPTISNVAVTMITDTSAVATWTTDILSDSTVDYGVTTQYDHTGSASTQTTTHSVTMSGLTTNTLYHFRVTSKTPLGGTASSADNMFTTLLTVNPVLTYKVTNVAPTADRAAATVTYSVSNTGGEAQSFSIDTFTATDSAITSADAVCPGTIPAAVSGVAGTASFTITWHRSPAFPIPSTFFGSFIAHYKNTAKSSFSTAVTLKVRVN